MSSDELVALIETSSAAEGAKGSWFGLVEALLRYASQRSSAYRTPVGAQPEELDHLRADVHREALPRLSLHRAMRVSPSAAAALRPLAVEHADRLGAGARKEAAVAVALGLADAVDDVMHATFVARFRDIGRQVLKKGEAHYVHRYHPGEPPPLVAGSINTDPAKMMAGDVNRTKHVRLAGEEADVHTYVLDWDAYGRLSPLASVPRLRVAACVPNVTLDEFDVRPSGDPEHRLFTNYGPRDDRHVETLLAQLHACADAGAHVVVFPEYTVPERSREPLVHALHARVLSGDPVPILVVAGTSTTGPVPPLSDAAQAAVPADAELERKRDNEACVLVTPGTPDTLPDVDMFLLRKLFPAVVDGSREAIPSGAAPHEFRIFMTQRFAIAVPICLDAMNIGVVRQFEDMGVNLLLVPSMSSKTSSLVQHVCQLAATSQAVVAFANAPAWWPDPETQTDTRVLVAFHGPYEAHPSPIYLPDDPDRPRREPAAWVWDVHTREVKQLNFTASVDETLDSG